MQKWILLPALICLITPFITSQQLSPNLLSSNGGIDQASGIQLEWTLGELAVEGTNGEIKSYTEGFLQPIPKISWFEIKSGDQPITYRSVEASGITLAPNPVASELTIRFNNLLSDYLTCTLLRPDGSLVFRKVIEPRVGEDKLDLTGLSPGLYLLQFQTQNDSVYPIYKVTKI